MLDSIKASQAEHPELIIYLALEAGEGSTDRGPLLTSVWDILNRAGIDIKLVGEPSGEQTP